MARRRRRRACQSCGRPVTFLISPFSDNWRTFEPTPVDRLSSAQVVAYPVESRRAWRPRDLVEDLMVRRRVSEDAARQEVDDMPWYQLHHCPQHDDQPDDERSPDAGPRP